MAGILYLVPTPIGNLGDISLRARQTLENADFIAAEDTRVSLKLLNHLEIKKPLVSYYEHNKTFKGGRIVERILAGETCALVSDAGSPAISDPGEDLVKECAAAGITVCAIPGPMIFYEAPHKLMNTLEDMVEVFGAERPVSFCRELTKLHEEVLRTTLGQAIVHFTETPPKGEFVLVVAGAPEEAKEIPTATDAAGRVNELISQGLSRKDAIKQTAQELGLPKNAVYAAALGEEE